MFFHVACILFVFGIFHKYIVDVSVGANIDYSCQLRIYHIEDS